MGQFPHPLTREEASRGGKRSQEVRREQGKSVRARIAEKLEADADEAYQSFKDAWQSGDWRAAQAALHEAFGAPAQTVEHTGAEGGPITVEHKARLTVADLANYLQPGDGPSGGPGGQLPALGGVLPDPGQDQPPAG